MADGSAASNKKETLRILIVLVTYVEFVELTCAFRAFMLVHTGAEDCSDVGNGLVVAKNSKNPLGVLRSLAHYSSRVFAFIGYFTIMG